MANYLHLPVLLKEVIALVEDTGMRTVVDCTLGGGGHSKAMLALPLKRLVGIDQDQDALDAASHHLKPWDNVTLLRGNFGQIDSLLSDWELPIDSFLFDLGVSSWQLDKPERGFAYQHDAPLDMRMDQRLTLSAGEILNQWPEKELTRIFRDYGEERWASRVAKFVVDSRDKEPVLTTGQLVAIIKAAIPASARRVGGHPGRRIFQALRIAVNNELDNLRLGLNAAIDLLAPGGRIIVISYHSLEDRIVKQVFRDQTGGCICPHDFPICQCDRQPRVRVLTSKPVIPGAEEIETNPRARSARLRAAEKLSSKGIQR